jgi:regulator of sigma E protease
MLVFPDPNVAAVSAGLRSGDVVTSLNGSPVRDQYQLTAQLEAAPPGPLAFEVERKQGAATQTIRASVDDGKGGAWSLARLGSVAVDFAVNAVQPASPAKRAGVQAGDLLIAVNGEGLRSLADLERVLRASGGGPVRADLLRNGDVVSLQLQAAEGVDPDPRLSLGIRFGRAELRAGERVKEVVRNPLVALQYGVLQTWQYFRITVDSLRRLLTREIGMTQLTGPIGIGEIAAESFAEDFLLYLQWLCIISVNLAIINLLPIPVLDGGHILFAAAEAVRGGPLGRRAREVAQTIGLSFVLMLMGLAFWNDLSRTWPRILNFFQGLL